jgi:hypothetical protein
MLATLVVATSTNAPSRCRGPRHLRTASVNERIRPDRTHTDWDPKVRLASFTLGSPKGSRCRATRLADLSVIIAPNPS